MGKAKKGRKEERRGGRGIQDHLCQRLLLIGEKRKKKKKKKKEKKTNVTMAGNQNTLCSNNMFYPTLSPFPW